MIESTFNGLKMKIM